MTRDESLTIAEMVANHWPGTQWNPDTVAAYAQALEPLDAHTCTVAVIACVNQLEYYPKIAVLREFYYLEKARERAAQEPADERRWPAKRETVPLWVRRWVAARYLHASFGKDQDMRRFPEQGDWGNPYNDLMPPDAWLEEAEHVTDDRVWRILQA